LTKQRAINKPVLAPSSFWMFLVDLLS